MTPVDYQSRAFMIGLLRDAKVDEEIVEDIADACELAEFSVFSLASEEIPVKTLAEKLYLTKQEALALRRVSAARLQMNTDLPINTKPSQTYPLPDFSKMISVHVVASHTDARHERQRSTFSVESFLGRDCEKKKVCTSSSGGGELGYHWTDSATDHETSSIDNMVGGSPNDHYYSRRPMHLASARQGMKTKGTGAGISLTDQALADHDRNCRPYVPRLQLEDAGLSYGPANSVCPSYTTLNSLTPSELEQLADLPVDYQHLMSRRANSVSEGAEKENDQEYRGGLGNIEVVKGKRNRKAHLLDIPPLPSYRNVSHSIHKTTAAFEASKRALKERQEYKAKMMESAKEPSTKRENKSKLSKSSTSRLLRHTKASLAWIDTRKTRRTDNLIPWKASSTSTIPSMLQIVVLPNRY